MKHIWIGFLPTLAFVAFVLTIQRELENTNKHEWLWIAKQPPWVLGVSCFSVMSFINKNWIIG